MKLEEKIEFLQDKHFNEWITARATCSNEVSNQQSMFCVCGRLATGFHESGCRKFNTKVNNETVKRLSYLLPKPPRVRRVR